MPTPLIASATAAGVLMSGFRFRIPAYQREYAWEEEHVHDFWADLRASIESDYFLGLVILTDEGDRNDVVDGQQRLVTLTLLASALHREATAAGRQRLADRIEADFLRVLDYDSDETEPRLVLTEPRDSRTLAAILNGTETSTSAIASGLSAPMLQAFATLRVSLSEDLGGDAFKRLGQWTDFLTNRLYFAVFQHPDAADAYRVFEVVNTRGRTLTTADLLKNYLLSRTAPESRDRTYTRWVDLADSFGRDASGFVTFIRHVASLQRGYILPKDLYDYLSGRTAPGGIAPYQPDELLTALEAHRDVYLQLLDPTSDGPASDDFLLVAAALNDLNVTAARPLLLALHALAGADAVALEILKIVVRRVAVGNLGSGGIERRLGDASREVSERGKPRVAVRDLQDLDIERADFERELSRRSYNKSTLSFFRRSVLQTTCTPERQGTLHFIRPRSTSNWGGWSNEEIAFWEATLGNTFLAEAERRARGANTWEGFQERMLPLGVAGEWQRQLSRLSEWDAEAVASVGTKLGKAAARVWYG